MAMFNSYVKLPEGNTNGGNHRKSNNGRFWSTQEVQWQLDFINNVGGLWQYSPPKTGGPVAVGIQTRDEQALSEKSWKIKFQRNWSFSFSLRP